MEFDTEDQVLLQTYSYKLQKETPLTRYLYGVLIAEPLIPGAIDPCVSAELKTTLKYRRFTSNYLIW